MYKLLVSKGYTGKDNLEDILLWLDNNDIKVGFSTVWSDDNEFQGYCAEITCPPHNMCYRTNGFKSYRNALEMALYKLIDYIPKIKL